MKKKLLTFLIGVSLVLALVTVPLMTACAPEVEVPEVEVPEVEVPEVEVPEVPEVAPKTVKFGYMAPLSGPAAMWGIPGLGGLRIWVDRVNAAGGLNVAGERYLVEVVPYDDEYVASKTLEGAKKLVLEDGVVVTTVLSGVPSHAAGPFLTEHKILTFTDCLEAVPKRPYFLATGANWPFIEAVMLRYYADTYPEIKRVAYTCQDDTLGTYSMAIIEASCEIYGWDLVYSKVFSPETVDFAPIMTAMLATNPDLIHFGGIWGDFRSALIEQAYLQGAKEDMLYHASEWDPTVAGDLAKLPADFLEGAIGAFPALNDPLLPDTAHEYWDMWHARYGPGAPEDLHRDFIGSDWYQWGYMNTWERGVEAAGSFDADAVRAGMLSITPFHVYGSEGWWGEELYGLSQASATHQYLAEVQSGKFVVIDELDFFEWLDANIDALTKWFTEYGMLWYQR